MQKTFCDKCGSELHKYEFVHVEISDKNSGFGRLSVYKNLCPNCKRDFIVLLNGFVAGFMDQEAEAK